MSAFAETNRFNQWFKLDEGFELFSLIFYKKDSYKQFDILGKHFEFLLNGKSGWVVNLSIALDQLSTSNEATISYNSSVILEHAMEQFLYYALNKRFGNQPFKIEYGDKAGRMREVKIRRSFATRKNT